MSHIKNQIKDYEIKIKLLLLYMKAIQQEKKEINNNIL